MDLGIFRNIPPVSKAVICVSTVLAIVASTEVLNEQALAFLPNKIAQGEVWRLFTGLFFAGAFDGAFMFNWALHQSYGIWLESLYYSNSSAFAWRLVVLSVLALPSSVMLGIRRPIYVVWAALEYLSTRCHDEERLLWFGMRVPAGIIPFHQFFSACIFKEPHMAEAYFAGIFLGHILLLLDDVYPKWLRRRVLAIPGEAVHLN